ncbi:unnamed protein product [Rhizophagus irregularis]|nr:unnamed protein product [Rhizophagus irregularis]
MEIARKSRSFTININENNTINNNSSVPLKVLKIGQLKYLIWHQKKVTLQLDDYDLMKLWMIDISEFKSDTIEEQIKKEVVEELDPFNYLSNYFSDQAAANKSIIIVQVPAITERYICGTEAYWKNVCKTYDWLKSLCQSSNKIATHKVFKGSKGRNGICKRFEKRKSKDRNLHPIPLLANGPDTGRSRLLQELPTLLREQAKNYTTDNELLKMINNQMYAINVTFGNDTPASDKDVCLYWSIVSVKYRLGKLYPFEEFRTAITPVIADAVLNIPVEENKTDGGLSYVDLSSKGILNLESAHNNDLFYVRMPYLWLWILISYNESFEFWEVMIDQKSHVLWQDSEDFNMRFWLYAFDFFQYWIKYNVNYKFVLPDADSIKYHELEYQYPYTVQQEHLSLGTVYKNCPNAPWDVFFFLENCLFAIRVKAKQPQVLNKSMINGDESMTEDALNNLQENCLVVHRANFKDFYGYIFSSRAEFSAANDKLDVNTAEDYELRTIKGIGNETAREIISKRPYVDEEDLYSQVKQNRWSR